MSKRRKHNSRRPMRASAVPPVNPAGLRVIDMLPLPGGGHIHWFDGAVCGFDESGLNAHFATLTGRPRGASEMVVGVTFADPDAPLVLSVAVMPVSDGYPTFTAAAAGAAGSATDAYDDYLVWPRLHLPDGCSSEVNVFDFSRLDPESAAEAAQATASIRAVPGVKMLPYRGAMHNSWGGKRVISTKDLRGVLVTEGNPNSPTPRAK